MNEIERQLEAARQNLLDLTRRNRLLNFRSTKSRTIEIIGPITPEIGKALVSEESYFSFSARGEIATRGKDSAEEIDEFQDSENC